MQYRYEAMNGVVGFFIFAAYILQSTVHIDPKP